ncbi:MAG: hypothetical protein H7A23_27120 [Leptospiraceae bacterium]|nr:hypothetical protein [Leptospiraceae bacterium]MCP5498244.1 hypothetical protein [Leptospiraceae bacterium]
MENKTKHIIRFFLIFVIFLFIVNCSEINKKILGDEDDSETKLLTQLLVLRVLSNNSNCSGGFWVRNVNTNKSYCSQATLVGSSNNLDLYVENGLDTGLDYQDVVNNFESKIYPAETEAFGTPTDINNDGKITVLIVDIQDQELLSSGFVAGFMDPVNFYKDSRASSIRSNQREIIYLDGKELIALRNQELALGRSDTFLSTLAHEYQHLIRYKYGEGQDDTWIDEGSSEAASDITGFGPQVARLLCFRGDSGSSCSGGVGGSTLFSWNSTLKNYAFAYTFMRYLFDVSGSSEQERYNFFKAAASGDSNGVRANSAENLIRVFMSSAAKYDSSVLGADTKTVFQKLFASYIAQSTGYTDLNNVYFGSTTAVDVDTVRTLYSLPSDFTPTIYQPAYSAAAKQSSYSLYPSQVYRVSGSTSGSQDSNTVIIKRNSSEFIIFNGNINATYSTTVSASIQYPLEIPKLHSNEIGIVCPMDYLRQVHKIEKKMYDLKLVKRF